MVGNFSLSQFSINSEPGSSLAIWPRVTSEILSPFARASRTYSAVSHSCISPTINTSGLYFIIASICTRPPAAPGINSTFLQGCPGLPTYLTFSIFSLFFTCIISFFKVVGGRVIILGIFSSAYCFQPSFASTPVVTPSGTKWCI